MPKEIISIDFLTKKLDEEFSWRRKELSVLKSKIPNKKDPLQSVMLRSATPLLYAHWEGFTKISTSYYLEHVASKHLNHNELNLKFVALSLQNKIGDINASSFELKVKTIETLLTDFSKRSNIPKKNIINTKSNLKYDVLKEILYILNLEDDHISGKKGLIDDLVDARNYIAHGEASTIDYDTFINFYTDIISLMEYIKVKIINSAVLEDYKKK